MAQERLTTGDAHLFDALRDEQPHHAQIIRHGQIGVNSSFIPGPAVDTLVVTAVGDRDPQIGDGAAVLVSEADCVFSSWLSRRLSGFETKPETRNLFASLRVGRKTEAGAA